MYIQILFISVEIVFICIRILLICVRILLNRQNPVAVNIYLLIINSNISLERQNYKNHQNTSPTAGLTFHASPHPGNIDIAGENCFEGGGG